MRATQGLSADVRFVPPLFSQVCQQRGNTGRQESELVKNMDTVANFLIRIKNSSLAGKQNLAVPFSKFNHQMAIILEKEGFLEKTSLVEEKGRKKLVLALTKKDKKISKIEVRRISKPGRRVYAKASDLKRLRGSWITVVSTPEGLFNAKEALNQNIGGEIICKIAKI